MGVFCFVVLHVGELGCEASEESGEGWHDDGQDDGWEEDQDGLEWTRVDFGDEDLDAEAGADQRSKHGCGQECEWNLQQLAGETLERRVSLDLLAGNWVGDFALVLKVWAWLLEFRHPTNTPLECKVDFLLLPVLDEDNTPEAVDNGVNWRVGTEQNPGAKSDDGWEAEEEKVGLQECKVEGNLFAETVAYDGQIPDVEEVFLRPLLNPRLVELVIVKRKNALHILPLILLRCNTRPTLVAWLSDHHIDETEALSLSDRLIVDGLLYVLFWCGCADAVEPVLDSGAIDFGVQVLLRCNADEYEDRAVVAVANFGCEADVCETLDKLCKAGFGFGVV